MVDEVALKQVYFWFLWFYLANPSLLHTEPPEVRQSPDQAAHNHSIGLHFRPGT
jgi:hypothetical protein